MTIRYFQTDRELDEELENQMEALEEKSRLQAKHKRVLKRYSNVCLRLRTTSEIANASLKKLAAKLAKLAEDLEGEINNMGV